MGGQAAQEEEARDDGEPPWREIRCRRRKHEMRRKEWLAFYLIAGSSSPGVLS